MDLNRVRTNEGLLYCIVLYIHSPTKVFVPINNLCHNWHMAEICCELNEMAHELAEI